MTKQIIRLWAVLTIILLAGCDSQTAQEEYGALSVEWENQEELSSMQVLLPGSSKTYHFKAANLKSATWTEVPAGWNIQLNAEMNAIEVAVPETDEGQSQEVSLKVQLTGLAGDVLDQELLFYYLNPKDTPFDDPNGAFILNEGNMTTENGSLSYITPDGYIIDDIYRLINGTELGNVCQDMCFQDGKIYIISQNGDENAVGTSFENDGMLVIVDAKTLKKEKAFTKEQLSGLYWPTHIAAIDAQHVYIRDKKDDKGGIWHLNTETGELNFVEGSDEAPQSPFAVVNNKVYSYSAASGLAAMPTIWEINPTDNQVKTVRYSWSINGIYAVCKADDNHLWVLDEYNKKYKIRKLEITESGLSEVSVTSIPLLPSPHGNASGKRFAIYGNTAFYNDDTTLYSVSLDEEEAAPQELIDLYMLDSEAIELYNGISVNPSTGYLYVNTIKGVGPFYTTNSTWVFNTGGDWNNPLYKYDDHTRFPAGIYFPPQTK